MRKDVPQALKVGFSVIALLIFLVMLAAFDSWIFREPGLPASPATSSLNDVREQTTRMYEAHDQWRLSYIQRTYEWQARSTKVIFWLSMLISVSGVGLSFWQFVASAKEAANAAQENEMEIKSKLISLAFKSRSIAALVLFVSMAYLALYTALIYPIKENTEARAGQPSQNSGNEEPGAVSMDSGPTALPQSVIDQASNEPLEKAQ